MPSPALRSRTVPSPNLQVTDGSQEGLHTANTVQALIERGREERTPQEGNWLTSPQMLSSSDLELGGQKSQSSCCFRFRFLPFPVLVVVALDGMDVNKCTFVFAPPPEARCLKRAFMAPVSQKQEGLEIIPQAKV